MERSIGDGGKTGRSPGRALISRKTIARGKPGCPGCTCSSTRVLSFTTFAHGTAGAVGARLSLRPLSTKRDNEIVKLGRKRAAGMITHVSPSLRAKRSNPALPQERKLDCFVAIAPRNDGVVEARSTTMEIAILLRRDLLLDLLGLHRAELE